MGGDERRRDATEVAAWLADPAGLRAARRLQLADLAGGLGRAETFPAERVHPDPRAAVPAATGGPRPISIWRPIDEAGETVWVRPVPGPFGDHYAARRRIGPKPAGTRRVCFFGESVAAGYLYAPHLTPAGLLERLLGGGEGGRPWEVVDLARTNETLPSLLDTVGASLQLGPDLLVLFVGNNWNLLETPEVSPYASTVTDRQRYALALRGDGLAGAVLEARVRLTARAEAALESIAELAAGRDVPLVVVLPEVNLADWQNRQPVHWLEGDGVARWYAALASGVEHLAERRPAAAEGEAWRMMELDAGLSPTGTRLLAEALRQAGDPARAREAALAEVDRGAYATMAFLAAPQAMEGVRRLLARAAERHGWSVVDLRRRFARASGEVLPGSELFLDYCHLTAEGMRLAMEAVARQVAERLDPPAASAFRPAAAPPVSAEAEATAFLGAAVHSAHRLLSIGPKQPLLERWCRAALDRSPGVAAAMLDLLAARYGRLPAVLSAAQARNHPSSYRLTPQHGWDWPALDADLVRAIEVALAERSIEVPAAIAGSLHERWGLKEDAVDLAAGATRLWDPHERFYPEVMEGAGASPHAFFRAAWPECSFVLVTDGAAAVELEITLRVPFLGEGEEAAVGVRLEGRPIGTLKAASLWRRGRLTIAREALAELPRRRPHGLHRLTLAWPLPSDGSGRLESARERLELGLEADLHPVFGEVFSLLARTV